MKKTDDDIINLREKGQEPEFVIGGVKASREVKHVYGDSGSGVKATPVSDMEGGATEANDRVKVKFDKFVDLIAHHAYEDIIEKHMNDDVVISTDLLTDLANASEGGQGKKVPMMFVLGIVIGGILVYILFGT